MKRLITTLLILLLSATCYAETIVFKGYPTVKGRGMSDDGSFNTPLSESASEEYKVIISKDGDKYYWLSRENKPLLYSKSGKFHNFVNPSGSGYIKIFQTEEGNYLYMEHMSLGLDTITYWGISEEFNP